MKKFLTILILSILSISLYAQDEVPYVDSRDYAVFLQAEVVDAGGSPAIRITWDESELASQYVLNKKAVDGTAWIPVRNFNAGEISEVIDQNVQPGITYEYEMLAYKNAGFNQGGEKVPVTFIATGYTLAGIEAPAFDAFGTALLVIDETITEPLSEEIERYRQDLRNEGWGVVSIEAPRAEQFDSDAVLDVKSAIYAAVNDYPEITTVVLLGRIPVPYSGEIVPDAHTNNHWGAWPADLYYGHLNETHWTDVQDYDANPDKDTSKLRDVTKNSPGDGKFDPSNLGNTDVTLAVGRIDMYNMPAFHEEEWAEPEIELLRRYLDKNHAYRTGEFVPERRGLIDDNFIARNLPEGFASTGWRNFGNILDEESVKKEDFITKLSEESYLFAYGTGPGSYIKADGIGYTVDFVGKEIKGVFTHLFGSYFGDWDVKDNFLRAPLAAEGAVLTNSWAARPHWFTHHMKMGFPIGFSTLLSQNNNTFYKPNIFFNANQQAYIYGVGMRSIHTALMGDPTLRIYDEQNLVADIYPENLSVTETEDGWVSLEWDLSAIAGDYHFNIYRSLNEDGAWERINPEPVMATSYIDSFNLAEKVYYAVRVAHKMENGSGSYYSLSNAAFGDVVKTGVEENLSESSIIANPNPATEFVRFTMNSNAGRASLEIFDIKGNPVLSLLDSRLGEGAHTANWNLRDASGRKVPAGVYIARYTNGTKVEILKVVVR
jgi:hypothetical protein